MTQRDELIASFTPHEVETAEDILACVKRPPTADKFRRLLLLLLRGHYSSSANYMGFDHLACYEWHPDPKQRRLEIEFTHNGSDRKPDAYPGIYVGFSSVDIQRLGLGGDFAGNTQDMAGTHVARESVATIEIHHVAKNASDAYDLAEMSTRVLTALGHPLARNAGASGFSVLGFAPPKEKNPSPEVYYTVAMPVRISYTLAVTRSLESHRIQRIVQAVDAET